MKKSHVIFICLLVFVVGSALGYYVGHRKGLRKAADLEWSDYMDRSLLNIEYEARAYFRIFLRSTATRQFM